MIDGLTLDQMRAFVAVADAGSFRAAAARLSRVQSAVSHAVAGLEAQLGVALFDRTGHRPALTAEGRALLADMRALLLKADLLRARARGMGEGVELGLSIAVDPLFPEQPLAAALAVLHAEFPSVGVRLWPAPLGAAEAALRDRRCGLALTTAEIADPRIEAEFVLTLAFVAVAAPSHPLAAAGPLSAAALADHLQIVVEDPSTLTEGRDFGVLSPGTWRVGDLQTKRALIRAGLGWGRLPGWLVERDLAEGRLARIGGRQGEQTVAAALAHRVDDPPGPAARRLRRALLDSAG